MMLRCALDCCFRMYEIRGWQTEVFVGDDLDDPADYAVCTADREAWEREMEEEVDGEYIGGVPVDCPIYQGEVEPPWEGEEMET